MDSTLNDEAAFSIFYGEKINSVLLVSPGNIMHENAKEHDAHEAN